MIEVGRIGFNLTLTGDAVGKLVKFKDNAELATEASDILSRAIGRLSESTISLADAFEKVNPLFKDFNTAVITGSSKVGGYATHTERLAGALQNVSYKATEAAAAIKGVTAASADSSDIINTINRGGGGGGGGGGSHRLAHMLGRQAGGGELGGFMAGRMLGATSMVGLGAAIGGVMLGKASYEAATKFQQAQVQFAGQGFGAQANASATKAALAMNIHGVSPIEALQAINDAATVTRNVPEAIQLAPAIAKMEYANKINYAQKGKQFSNNDEMRMLQFAELRSGSTDPKVFLPVLDLVEKLFASDAARLTTNDVRTGGRQGGGLLKNLSDQGLIELIPLFQSMGGARTMTGITTMQTSLEKGQNLRTGKKAIAEFTRIGIFKDGKIDPKFLEQLTKTPLEFLYKTLMPALKSHGITTDPQIAADLNILFSQSAARILQQALNQQQRIEAQKILVPQAAGIEQGYMNASQTNPGHMKDFQASWEALMVAVGYFSSPPINAGLEVLTSTFTFLAKVLTSMGSHPIVAGLDLPQKTRKLFGFDIPDYSSNNLNVNTAPSTTSKNKTTVVHTQVLLNSDVIAQSTSTHQAQALASPQIGTTQFNGGTTMGYTSPSYAGRIR